MSTITGLPKVDTCYFFPRGETNQQAMGLAFNARLRRLVQRFSARGMAVRLVDVANATRVGVDGRDQCPCRIHPDDAGYAAMGQAWFEALRDGLVWDRSVRAAADVGPDAEQERRDREEDRSLAVEHARAAAASGAGRLSPSTSTSPSLNPSLTSPLRMVLAMPGPKTLRAEDFADG